MAQLNFDATQVQPDAGILDPIPTDWYDMMIDQSELKPTKSGEGTLLVLRFTVLDGKFVNRKVFVNLNIRNQNPVAQEIAHKQLSAIAHAVGELRLADSAQLHGKPLKCRVKLVPPKDGYDAKNEITAYRNVNDVIERTTQTATVAPFPKPATFQQQPPQGMPQAMPQAAPAMPAQPWAQPPQAMQPPPYQAPAQAQPQQAPVQAQQPPQQAQPAWAQAPAPQPPAAPQQAQQADPAAEAAAQAQAAVPPWMKSA